MTKFQGDHIFGEMDHRLSVVKRWGILHTIQNQSVAEHVHNVVRITWRIGVGWFKLSHEELLTAVMWAHHHDDFESLSGDYPTTVKPYFDEEAFEKEHSGLILSASLRPPQHIVDIVKLADKMEGYHFLAMEMSLGNRFVEKHFNEEPSIIFQHIEKCWKGVDRMRVDRLFMGWLKSTGPDLRSIRHSKRGR